LGLETAVTTQKGLLYPEHAQELTALPRLSLNGDFQDIRYVKALLSGMPFALMNTLKRYSGPACRPEARGAIARGVRHLDPPGRGQYHSR
jgi:hypothetical protein